MLGVFIGRQPIFNKYLTVIGYELLFRSYDTTKADFLNGDRATSQVILNTFIEIGLERLIGEGLAFINLTRSFILEKYPLPLLHDRVVLEVLENVTVDDELITAVRTLSERGYKIALDDVINPNDVRPLLDIVDIVKLDLIEVDRLRLKEFVMILRKHNVKLLAEKIETVDDFNLCKSLGFNYFQGYFLSRPNVVTGRRMPESRITVLRLLSRIRAPDIEFSEIEKIVRQDVSLSYKLMRLINSSYYSTSKNIKSIRQALTLLGIQQIQDWVSLIFLSRIDDKPRELMTTAMIRAKMSELLAQALKEHNAEIGFTVGLFSVLDALLDIPMEEAVASLPLSHDVASALLRNEGCLGAILHCVLAYERGSWEEAQCPGLLPEKIRDIYLESLDWAKEIGSIL